MKPCSPKKQGLGMELSGRVLALPRRPGLNKQHPGGAVQQIAVYKIGDAGRASEEQVDWEPST